MRIRIVLNSYFSHTLIIVAMGVRNTKDNPDGLAYVFAAKLNIWPELGIIGNSRRAPALGHSSGLVGFEMTIVITAIIYVSGP